MAQMFPASLGPRDFHGSTGEQKLYGAFAEQLGDEWEVFHSVNWLRRTGERGAWEGEVDFVVAHPQAGILCLEAKGGAARFYGSRWQYRDGDEWKAYDRDPFEQAQDERHALKRLLGEAPRGGGDSDMLIGHGVSFPHVSVAPDPLPPAAPRAIIIDRHDVERLEQSVRNAITFFRNGGGPPGARGMKLLRECLTPVIEFKVPLAEKFLEEEADLVRLTADQTMLLRRFGHA